MSSQGRVGCWSYYASQKKKKARRQMVQGAHVEAVKELLLLNQPGFARGDSSRSKISIK